MDVQLRKRGAPVALALVFALVASACSAGGSPSPSSPASASPSASASASPSIDPTAPYTSKSGTLPTLRLGIGVPTLSFASLNIAQDMNFFGYQGVKVESIQLQSGTATVQALTGNNVDLVGTASDVAASSYAKGLDFQAIENTAMMTLQFCARKDWAQQHNVTASSPLADRMAAMKGATIGITGPGAASDTGTRFLLSKYGKLKPDVDVKLIQLGGAAAIPGALDAGQVQGFLLSPPQCGATKNGMVLVQPSDVPEFQNYVFEIVVGSKSWLQAHQDIATKVATAIAMANNLILEHPDTALKLLQKDFNTVDPQVVADGFNQTIKPQVRPNGKFDAQMWENTNQVLLQLGLIQQPVDTTEGSIWTNQYIGDASVR